MNSPPIFFHLGRHAPRQPFRIRPHARRPVDTTIVPSEVHVARAFARLAGLDIEGIGMGTRARATSHEHQPSQPDPPPRPRGVASRVRQWCRNKVNALRLVVGRVLPRFLAAV